MTTVFEIAQILVDHAVTTFPNEVGLIAYYGSHAKGTATATSDLDLFYVPDKGNIKGLTSQFVLDGLPYDFWPVSWEMLADIAHVRSDRPWAVSASLLADAKPLYHRSTADLARFEALQAALASYLRPEKRPFMLQKAFDAFPTLAFHLHQLRTSTDAASQYAAGWQVVNSSLNCLALVNQTYFRKGWGACWSEALQLAQRPANLEPLVMAIIVPQSAASQLAAAEGLVTAVRQILHAAQLEVASPAPVQEIFANSYFFIYEYKQKILAACARQDVVAAAYAAFQLQTELSEWLCKVENGFWPAPLNQASDYNAPYQQARFPDLLAAAAAGNLTKLAKQVEALDKVAREWYAVNGVALSVLSGVDELLSSLSK